MDFVFDSVQDENGKNFHLNRVAFMIVNGEIMFLEKSLMTHWEWSNSLGLNFTKDEFNNIVRGFYYDGNVVFYKGRFTYDDECIECSKKYINQIKSHCNLSEVNVWCGEIVGEVGTIWKHDLFIGKM